MKHKVYKKIAFILSQVGYFMGCIIVLLKLNTQREGSKLKITMYAFHPKDDLFWKQ